MAEDLPPLPPDLRFERLPSTEGALALSFSMKKEALGPHIRARWDWDEGFQWEVHKARFAEKPFFAIGRRAAILGTLSWWVREDHARFGEFYLRVEHQGKGLGTRILRHALAQADAARLPVRLEYLKWNPAGRLYLRHGFLRLRETDTHLFLERPVHPIA
jgi:GNAT superfamily N-acetyltransferase